VSESAARDASTPAGTVDPAVLEAHQRCLEAGAVVFEEGDPGRALYFIRSGEVELQRHGSAGPRCVARLGPGDFFGEQGALLAGPRRGRATVTRDAELLEVDAEVFEDMCLERPDIGLRISRGLAARAQALEQRLAGQDGENALEAMVRVLIRLAYPAGEGARVEGTLRLLAREAGLSLLDAHRAIQHLLEHEMVSLVEDVLLVPDLRVLAASVEPHASD
jgi:CRP-like cAMP-binding protein